MTMMGESGSSCVVAFSPLFEDEAKGESGELASARRVALVTEEWIPPQRPLSEEMTMKSLCGVGLSAGEFAKTSVAGVRDVL
jgi:hypothetical protein